MEKRYILSGIVGSIILIFLGIFFYNSITPEKNTSSDYSYKEPAMKYVDFSSTDFNGSLRMNSLGPNELPVDYKIIEKPETNSSPTSLAWVSYGLKLEETAHGIIYWGDFVGLSNESILQIFIDDELITSLDGRYYWPGEERFGELGLGIPAGEHKIAFKLAAYHGENSSFQMYNLTFFRVELE
jgi:hypothetical protein